MVYVTHIRLSGYGAGHERITDVMWRNPTTGATGQSSRATMLDWIKSQGGDARVRDSAGHDIRVGVVEAPSPYLRTYADGVWTDNLLALPRF